MINNNCNTIFGDTDPNPVSSNAVIWQGEDIPCLGICKGSKLTPLMTAIVTKLCKSLEDIDITEVELCPQFITALGVRDKTIANLFQVLFDYNCTLPDLIESIQDQINIKQQIVVDLKCITYNPDPCGTGDPEFVLNAVLQVIIDAFCDLKAEFTEYQNTILETISELIDTKITENNNTVVINNSNPIGVIFAYDGPLTNFDGTGMGVVNGPYAKYAICNGNNGTPDYRGFVMPMAIQGMGGNALDPLVDPSVNVATPTANYAVGSKGGKVLVSLATVNIPSHTHTATVNDPGHFHSANGVIYQDYPDFGNGGAGMDTWGGSVNTTTKTTGITVSISSVGGGVAHENRMPYKATIYIKKIA